jgi:uncharacterized protein YwgA
MGRLELDDIILAISEGEGGVVHGRTRLQKIAYFVTYLLREEERAEPGFTAHHYGPYSSALAAAASGAVARGILTETAEVFSSGDFAGHDMEQKRYSYKLAPARGEAAAKWRRERAGQAYERAVELARQVSGTQADYRVLSYAAKAHYVLRQEGKPVTRAAIRKRAETLGWTLSPEELEAGVKLLIDLGLITAKD